MSSKIIKRKKIPSKKFIVISSILIILCVASSGCIELTQAYIPSSILNNGWHENQALRESSTQSLGFEKWCSMTYEIKGRYPASLTVTTIKTLVLMEETELLEKTKDTIIQTLSGIIKINQSSEQNGERTIKERHKTHFIVYDGVDTSKDPEEQVKIIGELWNCGTSGTSIICIGMAYITNSTNESSMENTDNWQMIIQDPSGFIESTIGENGLIYNIICHS